MRLNKFSQCHPVNRRAGVNARVKTRNHKAQSPLSTTARRYGSGPSCPNHTSRANGAAGHRLSPNTAGLRMMRAVRVDVMRVCIGTSTITQPDEGDALQRVLTTCSAYGRHVCPVFTE